MSDARLPVGGAVIFTDPCLATAREPIQSLLDSYDWANLMPKPATPLEALGSAMTAIYPSPGGKIRHTCFPYENSSKGKKIGRHDKTEHLSVDDKFCGAEAIATLCMRYVADDTEEGQKQKKPKAVWTGEISLQPYDYDKERAILAHIKHVQEYIPSGKLRKLVTDIVEKLGGRRLIEQAPRKDGGDDGEAGTAGRSQGAMWITADVIPIFKSIAARIEAASARTDHHGSEIPPTRIHVLSIVADEAMARAIITMLMGVVEKETARVEERLAQPAMSEQQAANDITRALAVKEELERYEELLKQPLTGLKAKTDSLVVSIAYKSVERSAFGGPVSVEC